MHAGRHARLARGRVGRETQQFGAVLRQAGAEAAIGGTDVRVRPQVTHPAGPESPRSLQFAVTVAVDEPRLNSATV